jgi:hypothetical protein
VEVLKRTDFTRGMGDKCAFRVSRGHAAPVIRDPY